MNFVSFLVTISQKMYDFKKNYLIDLMEGFMCHIHLEGLFVYQLGICTYFRSFNYQLLRN